MSYQIAYVSSQCTHGAVVITGSPDRNVDNLQVARIGDIVACPEHGPNPIVNVLITQETDNLRTAHVQATAACGAMIIVGSPDVYVG